MAIVAALDEIGAGGEAEAQPDKDDEGAEAAKKGGSQEGSARHEMRPQPGNWLAQYHPTQ